MIEAVLTGMKTKVDELTNSSHNTFYTAISGRWYDTEGKHGATFPYAVIYALPATQRYTFDHVVYIIPVTINIFSKIKANTEIDDIFGKYKDLFYPTGGNDWTQLDVTSYTQVKLQPNWAHRLKPDGDHWQYSIEMTCEIQED